MLLFLLCVNRGEKAFFDQTQLLPVNNGVHIVIARVCAYVCSFLCRKFKV